MTLRRTRMRRTEAAPNDSARSNVRELGEHVRTSNHRPPVTNDPGSNIINQQPTHNSRDSNRIVEQGHAFFGSIWLLDVTSKDVDEFFSETVESPSPTRESVNDQSSIDQRHPVDQLSAMNQDMNPLPDFSQSTLDTTTSSPSTHNSQEPHIVRGGIRILSLSRHQARNDEIMPRRNLSRRTPSERNVSGIEEQRYLRVIEFS